MRAIVILVCTVVVVSGYLFGTNFNTSSSAAQRDVPRPVTSNEGAAGEASTRPGAIKAQKSSKSGTASAKVPQDSGPMHFRMPYRAWDSGDRKKIAVSDTMAVCSKYTLNEKKTDAHYIISLEYGKKQTVAIKTYSGRIASLCLAARKKEHLITVLIWRARTVICLTYDLSTGRLYENAFFEVSDAKNRRIYDCQVVWSILGIPYWVFSFEGCEIETWNGITGKCIAKYQETYDDKKVPK